MMNLLKISFFMVIAATSLSVELCNAAKRPPRIDLSIVLTPPGEEIDFNVDELNQQLNFRYVNDVCTLAGMSRPRESFQPVLDDKGIFNLIVSLTESPLHDSLVTALFPFSEVVHFPVVDKCAPEDIGAVVDLMDIMHHHLEHKDGRVAVHCEGGSGRTGTILACYLLATGVYSQVADVIDFLNENGFLLTDEQEKFVTRFSLS